MVVARSRGFGDVLKRAVASVEEHEIGAHVVGDVEVDPAVVVQVGRDDPEPAAVGPAHARRLGHVGEGEVAVVAVEVMPCGDDRFGRAVDPHLGRVLHERHRRTLAVQVVVRELPVPVIGDVEVEVAVVVVIEERPARRPAGLRSIPADLLMSLNVPSPLFR